MSFNLSINGHVSDDQAAKDVDAILRAKGEEAVAEIREAGLVEAITSFSAQFSGPSGSVNFLAAPAAEPVDADAGEQPPG